MIIYYDNFFFFFYTLLKRILITKETKDITAINLFLYKVQVGNSFASNIIFWVSKSESSAVIANERVSTAYPRNIVHFCIDTCSMETRHDS